MAKGSPLMGTQRGKLGESVLYRAYGSQIMRAKAASVKNPKSATQMLQRLVLASASKTAAVLRPILDHSFQSVQYGAESMRYARKLIIKELRAQAVNAFNNEGGTAAQVGLLPLTAQGASIAAVPVSQGSLIPLRYNVGDFGSSESPVGRLTLEDVTMGLDMSVGDFLAQCQADVNTQITFLFLLPQNVGQSEGGTPFFAGTLQLVRINFKADVDTTQAMFLPASGEEGNDNFVINQTLLDLPRCTNSDRLIYEESTGTLTFKTSDSLGATFNSIAAAAVIKSSYDGTKWLRSTQYMAVGYPVTEVNAARLQPVLGYNFFDEVLDSVYAEGTITEDRFLNKEKN